MTLDLAGVRVTDHREGRAAGSGEAKGPAEVCTDGSPRQGGEVRSECKLMAASDHLWDANDDGKIVHPQGDLILAMPRPSFGVKNGHGPVVDGARAVLLLCCCELGKVTEAFTEELRRARSWHERPVDIEENGASDHGSHRTHSLRAGAQRVPERRLRNRAGQLDLVSVRISHEHDTLPITLEVSDHRCSAGRSDLGETGNDEAQAESPRRRA